MTEKLEIFICEFITGGGLYNAPLPPSLADEGERMLQALVQDLLEIPDVTLTISRDERLPPVVLPVRVISIGENPWLLWQQCFAEADLVWLIAPESDDVLEQLTRMVPSEKLLGSDAQTVNITSSKLKTLTTLAQHRISVVAGWRAAAEPQSPPPWVAKPDDGAGCIETRYFENAALMQSWLADGRCSSHIVQPWQPGEPASFCMLCHQGQAWLLSANTQHIRKAEDGMLGYYGSVLNGVARLWPAFAQLAQHIAHALPGLAGYVGVDVMVHGGELTVLEINPRLTTSYVGLHQAMGLNPAKLVLDLLYNRQEVDLSEMERNVVDICLNA